MENNIFEKGSKYDVFSKILERHRTMYLIDLKNVGDGSVDLLFSKDNNVLNNDWSNVWINSKNQNYEFTLSEKK